MRGRSPSQLSGAEAQINSLPGAVQSANGDTVGALFSFTGKADYTLNIVNGNPSGNFGWQTNFLFLHSPGTVNAAAIESDYASYPRTDRSDHRYSRRARTDPPNHLQSRRFELLEHLRGLG